MITVSGGSEPFDGITLKARDVLKYAERPADHVLRTLDGLSG
jgi:hypothetical protein